jgi:formylglycine-generating enzyme required for sulfatase activity
MHGNVWQWCADAFLEGRSDRVLRGGGWNSLGMHCSATYRHNFEPGNTFDAVGFRLLAVPSGAK